MIEADIAQQLRKQHKYERYVEVVRTYVFTSVKSDTDVNGYRSKMISDLQLLNFDVQVMTTLQNQEKCVDIALAVEMLYMATVPDSYDIAVVITGDKDFMPAMQKTRLKAKRVALCSMQNSCHTDLIKAGNQIK